jgi:hypothetical protein
MFGFMAMNLLEFICRLCQTDPNKKALLDFSNELNRIEPKYFTHLPNDSKASKLLGINRSGFTLPYLDPNNNDNLLLTAIYDLIRNGVAHQYDQPIVDLHCLVATAATHKSNTFVCLVGMSTRRYLVLNVDQR